MIRIEKSKSFCSCCSSKNSEKAIMFMANETFSTKISLCQKCRVELANELQADFNSEDYTLISSKDLYKLDELITMEDIPSPTIPEYREHHESIQKILKHLRKIVTGGNTNER